MGAVIMVPSLLIGEATVSDVVRRLRAAREVMQKPTFGLFRKRNPEVMSAILELAFPDSDAVVDADVLHSRFDALLDELVAAGERVPQRRDGEDGSRITGRELCRELLGDKLLGRPADTDSYLLTPAAVQAQEIIGRLRVDRPLANSSRLNAILQAARDLSRLTTVDRTDRLAQLDSDIVSARARVDELVVERDRIAAGGEIDVADYGALIESYTHLDDLVRRLPTDLARVRESIDAEHRRTIAELRSDERSTGQAVMDHLDKTGSLLLDTPEGQAFQGVRELLADPTRLASLRIDLDTILSHAVFQEALRPDEQDALAHTPSRLRVNMGLVQEKLDRAMSTLSGYIVSRGLVSERELGRVLNDLGRALTTVLDGNPRAVIDLDVLPEGIELKYLRERFDGSIAEPDPQDLADTWADQPEPPSLAELVALGGPRPETLRHVVDNLADRPSSSLAEVFNDLPVEFRRPVELWGLWQAAASSGFDFVSCGTTEEFHVVRPDGSSATFVADRILLSPGQIWYLQSMGAS